LSNRFFLKIDARQKHMTSSRMTALISVMLLISLLSVVSIYLVLVAGTTVTRTSHASNTAVEHRAGTIYSIGNQSFVLAESNGVYEQFICSAQCLQSENHMLRHKIEHAKTDVYYIHKGNQLVAIDVD
jgi:hypothetical protein